MPFAHVWPQRMSLQLWDLLYITSSVWFSWASEFCLLDFLLHFWSLPTLSFTWMLIFSHVLFLNLFSSDFIQPLMTLSSVWYSLPNYRTNLQLSPGHCQQHLIPHVAQTNQIPPICLSSCVYLRKGHPEMWHLQLGLGHSESAQISLSKLGVSRSPEMSSLSI